MNERVIASDLDGEVRHLLRSLNDAAALRANRLACRLAFPGDEHNFVEAVRSLVRSALPAGSRLAAIVERSDVNGEPHKVVAADLGLGMRQFYRDRSHARALVRSAVTARLDVRVEHNGNDVLADEFERLHETIAEGRTAAVIDRTGVLLAAGIPEDLVPHAIALRVRALGESGQRAAALDEMRRARPGADDAACSEMAFACGWIDYIEGRHAEARVHAQGAVEASAPGSERSERGRRMHARHLAMLANIRQEDDDPDGALATFEHARHLLRSCRVPPQRQLLQTTIELAMTRLARPEMIEHAATEALEAYRSAAWHGIEAALDWADVALGLAQLGGGSAQHLLPPRPPLLAGATFGGSALGRFKLLQARMQAAQGNARAALTLIREAREVIPAGNYLHAAADLRESEALLSMGRMQAALPLATGVIERLTFGASSHYSGAAHVAASRALYGLGDRRRAREHCEAGLRSLRRGALVHDLSRALRFAADLTGDARYAREERDLLAG